MHGEIEITSLEKKIKSRVKNQMGARNQRDYYLNEQMKAISKEMGREDDPLVEVDRTGREDQSQGYARRCA